MFSLVVQFYPHVPKTKQESGLGSRGESDRKSHTEQRRSGRGQNRRKGEEKEETENELGVYFTGCLWIAC